MRNVGIEIEPAVVKKNLRYAYGPDAGGCGLSISVGIGGVSFERDRGLGVAERNIRGESGVGRICVDLCSPESDLCTDISGYIGYIGGVQKQSKISDRTSHINHVPTHLFVLSGSFIVCF